jgi:hypothetical protein
MLVPRFLAEVADVVIVRPATVRPVAEVVSSVE